MFVIESMMVHQEVLERLGDFRDRMKLRHLRRLARPVSVCDNLSALSVAL
jgi:hypothetical protein